MSAFVVEDKTINQVVTLLATGRDLDWIRRQVEDQTGLDLSTKAGQEALAVSMFQLNVRAVDARYGDGEASGFRPLDFRYRLEPSNPFQALKSLDCWHYQCSEGDVPDSSELYQLMDRVSGWIAHHLIRRLPQYETAKW